MDGIPEMALNEVEEFTKHLIARETRARILASQVAELTRSHAKAYSTKEAQEAGYNQCRASAIDAKMMRAASMIQDAAALLGEAHCEAKKYAEDCGIDVPVVAFR